MIDYFIGLVLPYLDLVLAVLGTWLLSAGLYSLALYLGQPGIDGKKQQTWLRDHALRVLRSLIAVALIVIAFLLRYHTQ